MDRGLVQAEQSRSDMQGACSIRPMTGCKTTRCAAFGQPVFFAAPSCFRPARGISNIGARADDRYGLRRMHLLAPHPGRETTAKVAPRRNDRLRYAAERTMKPWHRCIGPARIDTGNAVFGRTASTNATRRSFHW
jgi:hypothetical protein